MRPSRLSTSTRRTEQGGMLIIVALMLLSVVTIAAFTLSRSALKELATTGNVFQAGRAETASDAGIDWFLAWNDFAEGGETVKADTKQATVTARVLEVQDNPQIGGKKDSWIADLSKADDPFTLQGLNKDKAYTQAFDLQFEYLGAKDGDAAGGKNLKSLNTREHGWELTSTGQALVKTGSGDTDYLRYRTVRAAKLEIRGAAK